MSFSVQDAVYVSAAKGINTEANLVNFPAEYVVDEENFVITRSGAHHKRLGLDFEPDYALGTETAALPFYKEGAVTSYVWNNSGNEEGESLLVVQEGSKLYFYKHSIGSISGNDTGLVVDLDYFIYPTASSTGYDSCEFASGFGVLYVASKAIKPIMIAYDKITNTLVPKEIKIKVRDVKGVVDGLRPDEKPVSLSSLHKYNLINQGWTSSYINSYKSSTGSYPSNAQVWIHGKTVDPETGNEVWTAAGLNLQQFGSSLSPRGYTILEPLNKVATISTVVSSQEISNISVSGITDVLVTIADSTGWVVGDTITFAGTSAYTLEGPLVNRPVPQINGMPVTYERVPSKKYYEPLDGQEFTILALSGNILTVEAAFVTTSTISFENVGTAMRLSITELAGEEAAKTSYSSVEFAHGRAWFSGLGSDEFSSYVFFSRVLEDPSFSGQCYQDADPTSEHISDLIATDGGHITIPEAGTILKLFALDRVLIVFATKGIWTISGKDTAFTATDYEVSRISTIKLLGKDSIIDAEGTPIFFTDSGIYTLQADQITGNLTAQSLSISTVQDLFQDIPRESLKYCSSVFDPINKVAYWAYKSKDSSSIYRYDYDRVLCFDGALQAFYKHKLGDGTPMVSGLVLSASELSSTLPISIEAAGVDVQVGGVDVTVPLDISSQSSVGILGLTAVPSLTGVSRTFSRFTDTTFMDWVSHDSVGVGYVAYIDTGYEVLGDLMREKQVQYLHTFFDRTESGFTGTDDLTTTDTSSCLVTVRYGWAGANNTQNSFGPKEAYIDDRDFYVPQDSDDTFDTGFPITYTRIKPRGAGKAIQFRFESPAGKDCRLLGWAAKYSGGTSV